VGSDLELLDAWRAGDRAAGDTLILRHLDSICRFFRTKLGDDIEDLVQRTFLDLLDAVNPIANLRATLFTIAHRRLIDHLRERLRQPIERITSMPVADLGTSPTGIIARNDDERRLHEALRRISLDHQIILELAYWEDLSGAEIASILDISEHTVRSRLSRAREALRTEVERIARNAELARSTLDALGHRE